MDSALAPVYVCGRGHRSRERLLFCNGSKRVLEELVCCYARCVVQMCDAALGLEYGTHILSSAIILTKSRVRLMMKLPIYWLCYMFECDVYFTHDLLRV